MTLAVLSILLLLVGLPLLAWWLGTRGFWSRLSRKHGDEVADILARHGLSGGERLTVTAAVERGAELQDPRQRRAAVELAQLALDRHSPGWDRASRGQRIAMMLTAAWVLGVIAVAVFQIAFGRLGDVNWVKLVAVALVVGLPFRYSMRLRRSIQLNSDRTAPGE